MIILDTGPLVAFCDQDDPLHARAIAGMDEVFSGTYGGVVTTDHVVEEALTFLQRRLRRVDVSRDFMALVEAGERPAPAVLIATPLDVLSEAIDFHLDHFDRKLSVTDCTLIVHARRNGAKVLTFDRGFAGLAETVVP